MSPVSVRVGGAWKTASAVYTRVGGVWKTASDMPVRVGGVWKTGILQAPSDFELIQTITVGSGGASSVTFSSIPSTYKHLQIRGIGRTTGSTGYSQVAIKFNSDAIVTNYRMHALVGNGSTATSNSYNNTYGLNVPNADRISGMYGAVVIDIFDYANTSKNTVARLLWGIENNGSGTLELDSYLWMNTAAVTTISFTPYDAPFAQYSSFSLYGYK